MHRKGRQDARRAKIFTRLAREIQVAAKMGAPDPAMNPRLRLAIQNARTENMPKDRIETAIKKAAGPDAENLEEVRYEGYGPDGVAVIVETLTDNRNRTAADVRAAFSKFGGSLGETNSVSFQFDRVGEIVFAATVGDLEAVFDAAIDAGADNVETVDDGFEITCEADNLHSVREALEATLGEAERAVLIWRPQVTVPIDSDKAQSVFKLLDVLDDNDDVQRVTANAEFDDAALEQFANG